MPDTTFKDLLKRSLLALLACAAGAFAYQHYLGVIRTDIECACHVISLQAFIGWRVGPIEPSS